MSLSLTGCGLAPPVPGGRDSGGREAFLKVFRTLLILQAHEIRKQPISSPNPLRQLPEKHVAGVGIGSLAVLHGDQASRKGLVCGVAALQQGCVFWIERSKEISSPLLYPAIKIRLRDPVRYIEQRMGGLKDFHGRFFFRDAIFVTDREGIRAVLDVADVLAAVVLNDKIASIGDVIEKSFVVISKVFANRIRPHTENDRRKFREVRRRKVLRRQ